MPEPDFDQIADRLARQIVEDAIETTQAGQSLLSVRQRGIFNIVQELRQAWNARGAADMETIDYRDLLIRYIAYVVKCEGVDHISPDAEGYFETTFSAEERKELRRFSRAIRSLDR